MNMRRDEPASPGRHYSQDGDGNFVPWETWAGLSIREHYAAEALPGWIVALAKLDGETGYSNDGAAVEAARLSVVAADSLLHFLSLGSDA